MPGKFSDWVYGILGTAAGFMLIDNIRFRHNIPERYVLKDDFVRLMNENRQDHQIIFNKLDAIRDKLDEKADKGQ